MRCRIIRICSILVLHSHVIPVPDDDPRRHGMQTSTDERHTGCHPVSSEDIWTGKYRSTGDEIKVIVIQ